MSPARRRFSSIIVFSVTILLATAICSALYFFKIQKNEDYQNQLHFRELNEVALSISNGIEQLSRVANVPNDPIVTSLQALEETAQTRVSLSAEQSELTELLQARETTKQNLNKSLYLNIDDSSPMAVMREDRNDLLSQQKDKLKNIQSEQDGLFTDEARIQKVIDEYLQSVFVEQQELDSIELVLTHCDAYEEQEYCRYVSNIYNALTFDLEWIDNLYFGEAAIAKEKTARWQSTYENIRQRIVDEQTLLEQIRVLVGGYKSAKKTKQTADLKQLYMSVLRACGASQLSLCVQLSTNDNQKYTRAIKSVQSLDEQTKIWLNGYESEYTHLSSLFSQQLVLLDHFASSWQSLVQALQGQANTDDAGLAELADTSKRISSGAKRLNKLETELKDVNDQLSQIEQALAEYAKQQSAQESENLRRLTTELADLEQQIEQLEAQQQAESILWQQALKSAQNSVRSLSPGIRAVAEERVGANDLYSGASKLLAKLPSSLNSVNQDTLEVINRFQQDFVDGLIQSEMRNRARLATGGEALRNLSILFAEQEADMPADQDVHKKVSMRVERQDLSASSGLSTFVAPLADMIPSQLLLFPYILLADQNGKIIARKEVLANAVDTSDLEFENVTNLFDGLADSQLTGSALLFSQPNESNKKHVAKESKLPQYSGMLEREIGGIPYRVYIQPVSGKQEVTNLDQLYLVGLVPLNKLRFEKLRVSPTTAMWFVLGLICLIALIPLLKLRFVSVRYSFGRADVSQIGLGLIILLGVLCIGISDQFFFSYYKFSKVQQAESIYTEIQSDFANELEAIRQQRQALLAADTKVRDCLFRINRTLPNRTQQLSKKYVGLTNCDHPGLFFGSQTPEPEEPQYDYLAEGAFWLDHNGNFAADAPSQLDIKIENLQQMMWLNKQLHIANDIPLAHRDYFKRALDCELWGASTLSCRSGFTIQRINNVRDARKNSQFAFAEFDSIFATQMSERLVSSLGIRLRSFFARVLPKDFGYLIFSPDGQVQYHDNDSRSLLENVFVETNDNQQLRTIVNHGAGEQAPIHFETLYRNSEHLFVAGKLHPDLPWYLVVYQSQTPVLVGNMLLVFISICLFIALVAPLFLWFRYATDQSLWRRLLLFSAEYRQQYAKFAWWAAAASVFCLLSMGVIHELIARLLCWLLLCLVLLYYMFNQFGAKHNGTVRFSHPLLPAVLVLLVLAGLSLLHLEHFTWGTDINDLAALGFGMAIATAMLWYAKRPVTSGPVAQQLDTTRYNRGYCWFLVALCWLVAATPAMLIVNSANKYLLLHQAHIHSNHLQQAQANYAEQVDRYLELMRVDPQQYRYQDWLTKASLESMYPAASSSRQSFPWVSLNPADQPKDNLDNYSESPDLIIETLVKQSDIGGAIDADLHYLAKQDDEDKIAGVTDRVSYDADRFLLSAAIWQSWLILLMLSLLLFTSYKLIRLFLIQRLLGEHVPDNFRQFETSKTPEKINWFKHYFERTDSLRVQLIRSTSQRACYLVRHIIKQPLYQQQALCIQDSLVQTDGQFDLCEQIHSQLQARKTPNLTLILTGLDDLAFDKDKRQQALLLLRQLCQIRGLQLILLCEVAPLFRLVKQDAYPGVDPEQLAGPDEILAWSKLLAEFDKQYDWSPSPKRDLATNADLAELLDYECQAWPQLLAVKQEFEQYHLSVKGDEHASTSMSADSLSEHWTQDQLVEFFASHAGAIYRSKWQQCTRDEKLLLYQVATGFSVNPANIEVLEHLVRRGYLYRDAGWHVVNFSFRRFVLSAENEQQMAEWIADAHQGVWQFVRVPIMVATLVLVVLILLGTGEGLESILAILSALLGLIPLLLRNFSSLTAQQTLSND